MASYARVGLSTIKEFEKSGRRTIPATLAAMQQTLEKAGITFIGDADGKPTGIHVSPTGHFPVGEVGLKSRVETATDQSEPKYQHLSRRRRR
jgi:hypothetical protein